MQISCGVFWSLAYSANYVHGPDTSTHWQIGANSAKTLFKLNTKSRATAFENHVTLNPNSFWANRKILKAHSILDNTSCEFLYKTENEIQ